MTADPDYVAKRRVEILHDHRRSWNCQKDADGDLNLFKVQFVLPLRELKVAGLFERPTRTQG
jgi:hypothetical protein